MRRRLGLVIVSMLAAALAAVPAASAGVREGPVQASSASSGVTEIPIAFRVRNVNRTPVDCETDGRSYTIRGKLVGPRGGLLRADSATLYLHGLELGGFFFNFEAVRGYDFAAQQAQAGLTSVVIDRLGYDRSSHPNGLRSCIGGQADIANQVVQALKSGDYRASGVRAPRFERVAVAGHSVGGQIAQIVGYSFDDADAVLVLSYSDTVVSDLAKTAVMSSAAECRRTGGVPAEGNHDSSGYTYLAGVPDAFQKAFFFAPNTRRAVLRAGAARANRDPCGDLMSYMAAVQSNLSHLAEVDLPVLLVIGLEDQIYPLPAGREQEDLFTGTTDVSLVQVPRTGHALTLHRTEPNVQAAVANWLLARGYGGDRQRAQRRGHQPRFLG